MAPPSPAPKERKEKSRFPFRRGDSSRSFQEVDSPPIGQDLTPVASREPEPPTQPVQPQYQRADYSHGETNGLMGPDGSSDLPTTNGNNFMDRNIMDRPLSNNMNQPLPQVRLYQEIVQEARLTDSLDTSRA